MDVRGKRVGVRWDPPALVYVYQQGKEGEGGGGTTLRMARIPLRELEGEELVSRIYRKHGLGLLRGLDTSHVERMVRLLRHHHGIETPQLHSSVINYTELDSRHQTDIHSNGTKHSSDEILSPGKRKITNVKTEPDNNNDGLESSHPDGEADKEVVYPEGSLLVGPTKEMSNTSAKRKEWASQERGVPNRNGEEMKSDGEGSDTDVDLEQLDIPLDLEEPPRTDDDDFWS